jgi:hypothetical protein
MKQKFNDLATEVGRVRALVGKYREGERGHRELETGCPSHLRRTDFSRNRRLSDGRPEAGEHPLSRLFE